jgi:hypothetical protein
LQGEKNFGAVTRQKPLSHLPFGSCLFPCFS